MQKNDLLRNENSIFRVLQIQNDMTLIIDCVKRTMPKWCDCTGYISCSEDDLIATTKISPLPLEELDADSRHYAYEHYNMIAGVLPFVDNDTERCNMIGRVAALFHVSKQTIRNNLCLYLSYQNISVLAPKKCSYERPLTEDEKNIRWALNKYFYTQKKNSLQTAYTIMLKEKYCDSTGLLFPNYPTMNQFRYFYRKHKKMQTYYISRDGLKNYQRNNRPLIGDGIQSFAPAVGTAMLDSTICDIYLVDDVGNLVGRPILTACVDAYSGLCCGYSLSWEGGVYSLRGLMSNVLVDKVQLCNQFGICLEPDKWASSGVLPGILVTDMGSEYKSENFEQIAELGITIINLPAYRPELKGAVEKFFDVIQGIFKPYLKGKGVIEPDYQERGAHDYRKDACLTMRDFEIIILRCLIHYNSKRILDAFPYTENMIADGVKPYANEIWNWGRTQAGATLIQTNYKQLILTLFPRTNGHFSRKGLKVNKLRYHCEGYTERYLKGGVAVCAYNPENVSSVWLIENGQYIEFSLIESRFQEKTLDATKKIQQGQTKLITSATADSIQAKIDLISHIQTIAENATKKSNVNIGAIRHTRQKERANRHTDYMKAGTTND